MNDKILSNTDSLSEYYGSIILQSFSALLLCNISKVDKSIIETFLSFFEVSLKICAQYTEAYFGLFVIFFEAFFDDTNEFFDLSLIDYVSSIMFSFFLFFIKKQGLLLHCLTFVLKLMDTCNETFCLCFNFINSVDKIIEWDNIKEI